LGREPLESKKGSERAQKFFKILNFENFETFRKSCASVDVGIFLLRIFGGKKCSRAQREVYMVTVDDDVTLRGKGHVMLWSCLLARYWLL